MKQITQGEMQGELSQDLILSGLSPILLLSLFAHNLRYIHVPLVLLLNKCFVESAHNFTLNKVFWRDKKFYREGSQLMSVQDSNMGISQGSPGEGPGE